MLYIIRHGQTEMNSRHVLQGRSDFQLNDAGLAQAREAAERLRDVRFDRVYSSPLLRAVQTAEQIAPGAEILTFFSDFVHNPAPAGMEQLGAVVARVGAFLEELRESEENILISTHAIAMKGILEYLTPESNGAYWLKFIGNCAVYTSQNQNGQFTVPTELP